MPFLLETADIEEACILCRDLGLDFVELNMNFPACQDKAADVQYLHRLMRSYDVAFTLHLEEECDPFAFNPQVRRAWMESIRRMLTVAQAIDAPIVNMHLPAGVYITLPGERVYLYRRYAEHYRACIEELRDLCEGMLEGSGVHVAVENTNGFAQHEQEAVRLLLESRFFGLTLDIGHAHAANNVDMLFYQENEDRLIHMHAHDAVGKRNHLCLGEGEIDLQARFDLAARRGCSVVLETKTVEALRTSVARIGQWSKKI